MNIQSGKPLRTTLTVTAIAVLALGLAACDQKLSAEKVGQKIDRSVDLAEQRIAKAADSAGETMAGAKSAVSEKTAAAGATLGDAAITAKVKSALLAEPGLRSTGIDVVTEEGVVRLFGTTVSDNNRDKATRVAAAVEGVKAVENNLAIVQGS